MKIYVKRGSDKIPMNRNPKTGEPEEQELLDFLSGVQTSDWTKAELSKIKKLYKSGSNKYVGSIVSES